MGRLFRTQRFPYSYNCSLYVHQCSLSVATFNSFRRKKDLNHFNLLCILAILIFLSFLINEIIKFLVNARKKQLEQIFHSSKDNCLNTNYFFFLQICVFYYAFRNSKFKIRNSKFKKFQIKVFALKELQIKQTSLYKKMTIKD